MDTFLLFGIIGFSVLIISFILYSATTNQIIRDQDEEIETLRRENKDLKIIIKEERR